jgi:hypothetical protein
MMHFSPTGAYNETRWNPFPREPTGEMAVELKMKDLPLDELVPDDVLALAAPQYTLELASGRGTEGDTAWDWARGRLILFVGKCLR